MLAWWRERMFLKVQKEVNNLPDKLRGNISDKFHTFDELYEHRITLYIALCKVEEFKLGLWVQLGSIRAWRSRYHSDGSEFKGWFILGLFTEPGKQITYHLPIDRWDDCYFAKHLDKAPEWDGHTSAQVLERLKLL